MAQTVKHLPIMQETRVRSLGQEDLLKKEMVTHSSTLAWKIFMDLLQSMGWQTVRHNWATSLDRNRRASVLGCRGALLPSFSNSGPQNLNYNCWWALSDPRIAIQPTNALKCFKHMLLNSRDFPGGPVVKSLRLQCRGHGFNSWLGNLRSHMPCDWAKKKFLIKIEQETLTVWVKKYMADLKYLISL